MINFGVIYNKNIVGGFDCICATGYEGALCEVEANECLSNPCQNEAKCQDQVNIIIRFCFCGDPGGVGGDDPLVFMKGTVMKLSPIKVLILRAHSLMQVVLCIFLLQTPLWAKFAI